MTDVNTLRPEHELFLLDGLDLGTIAACGHASEVLDFIETKRVNRRQVSEGGKVSSDNFWFTRGGKVYMGFVSNFNDAVELAEKQILDDIVKRGITSFEGTPEEAREWANREYAEYGYWGER